MSAGSPVIKDLSLPFDEAQLRQIAKDFPTPFYLYDERAIRENARRLKQAFAWNEGFQEFFAVKATPNPHILRILAEEGFGADCSSLAELVLADRAGLRGESILFSSNNTPASDYVQAKQQGAVLNLDDFTHIDFVDHQCGGLPEVLCFRYNPGPLREGNTIIGKPEEAKYGFTREQLFQGYKTCHERGVRRFGLHTMVASNELDGAYFAATAEMLFEIAVELQSSLGIRLEFVNIGGGIGIPYRPDQSPVDLERVGADIEKLFESMLRPAGLHSLRVLMENGRVITGPYGYLVTTAIHKKHTYKEYIGVDACMSNLMRPGMYGAYHHLTVMGKEHAPTDGVYDVVGSLCENNDKFAIDRPLPAIKRGDLLVIHDAGAHGHSMGFQYNGKLRSAELLLQADGGVRLIRRAETLDDYFATLQGLE